jgi:hypothetical protein
MIHLANLTAASSVISGLPMNQRLSCVRVRPTLEMISRMIALGFQFKILKPVVEPVSVLMMNTHSLGDRTIIFYPDQAVLIDLCSVLKFELFILHWIDLHDGLISGRIQTADLRGVLELSY